MRIQLVETENNSKINDNLKNILETIKVDNHQVDLFVYPECSLTGYELTEDVEYLSDNYEGFKTLESLCKENDKGIFLGGVHKTLNKKYNGYFGFLPKLKSYYKTHLGKREATFFESGDELIIFEFKGWKIGVAICIESHIPDLIQAYRLRGCQLIIMPFASPGVCGNRLNLWEKYMPTRAYDNGVYIAAVNLKDDYFSGGQLLLNPKGEVVKPIPNTTVYDLDLELVNKTQQETYKCNYITRRRPELY